VERPVQATPDMDMKAWKDMNKSLDSRVYFEGLVSFVFLEYAPGRHIGAQWLPDPQGRRSGPRSSSSVIEPTPDDPLAANPYT
jgi:hypothetical protein